MTKKNTEQPIEVGTAKVEEILGTESSENIISNEKKKYETPTIEIVDEPPKTQIDSEENQNSPVDSGEKPNTDLGIGSAEDVGPHEVPKQKKKSRKKKSVLEAVEEILQSRKDNSETEMEETDAPEDSPVSKERPVKPKKKSSNSWQNEQLITLDERRSVVSSRDKQMDELIDLMQSLKSRRILSGIVQGVERSLDGGFPVAVVYYGSYKITIPAEDFIDKPNEYKGTSLKDSYSLFMGKRLGAEIDYIVKKVDDENKTAVASRKEAMKVKRKMFYFNTNKQGKTVLYNGRYAEARIVSSFKDGVIADIFGQETYIPLKELSYHRMHDASQHFVAGERVIVKLLKVEGDIDSLKISASIKQAQEDPFEKAFSKYSEGNMYVGTVNLVSKFGVFVSLEGGIDCLCALPPRGRPPVGARVTIEISRMDKDENKIWGIIHHFNIPR